MTPLLVALHLLVAPAAAHDAASNLHAPPEATAPGALTDHGSAGQPVDQTGLSDPMRIEALLKAQFDRPDAPLIVAPIVVRGDVAVAGWSQQDRGGRAFLRSDAQGWVIELCSGESLKHPATFQAPGLMAPDAQALAAKVAAAEADDPALTARLDAFEGTVLLSRAGGH
jgi:hypothetical protein